MKVEKKRVRRLGRYWILSTGILYFVLWYWLLRTSDDVYGSKESDRDRHAEIDVVGIAVKPTCVTKRAILALNQYLAPRRIIVVTTTSIACQIFKTFATNVDCLVETELLPGVSRDTIDQFLNQTYPSYKPGVYKGRNIAGWYLQQFLKMGASMYIPDLSEHHVVWDLDMILLNELSIFYKPKDTDHLRTIVNIGGTRNSDYDFSYRNLTGNSLQKASNGSSYVTHWMVVFKPYMIEFINFLATKVRPVHAPVESPWVWSVLSSLPADHLNMGFSEYASYISWILYHYPETIHIMDRKTWSRHPIGGMSATTFIAYWFAEKICCPQDTIINSMKRLGYQYVGVEIGHYEFCHYNDPEHENGYGM